MPKPNPLEKLYAKAATKILGESLHLGKGESLTIETWNNGEEFARKLAMEARRIGAMPLVVLEDEEAYVQGVKKMDREMLGKMGKQEYALLSATDAYVFIPGPPLSAFYSRLTPEERALATAYNPSWYEAAEKARLRGARINLGYVTKDMAKVLGKSQEKIIAHQLNAVINADFASMSKTGQEILQLLPDGASCTLTSTGGSRLEFKLQGDAEVDDGIVDQIDVEIGNNMVYMPPGFVSKRVDSSSVSGRVKSFASASRFGHIKDSMLEFESGKLVKWESRSSKKALDKTIDSINEENRKLGILAIGLNPAAKLDYGVDRFVQGAVSLNVAYRLTEIVTKGSLSVDGKEIVNSGDISTA